MLLKDIARQFDIKEIYVFGSRAKEIAAAIGDVPYTATFPKSDVDIGVQPGKKLSAREKVLLTIALEDFLDVGRVDLVVIPEADPFLAADIIRGEILYCSDPDEQAETELQVLRIAGDLAYYKKERIKSILSGTA